MPFIYQIKNYLNFIHDTMNNHIDTFGPILYLKYNCLYLYQMIKNSIIYIVNFDWISDFIQLPTFLPHWWLCNLQEINALQNPNNFLFNYNAPFFDISSTHFDIFFMSLGLSLLFWLPHSSFHFLILRRFLVQGTPAGIISVLGTLTAQLLFLMCLLFGWRLSLFNSLFTESWNYIFHILTIGFLIYIISHSPIKRIRFSNRKMLSHIFILNFIFVGFENFGLFPHLAALNIFDHFSLLQIHTVSHKCIYLMGFLVGSIIWTILLGYIILFINQKIVKHVFKSYSNWIQQINFICLTLILAFGLASIPYYGIDYSLLSSIGIYSQDSNLNSMQLTTDIQDVFKGRLGEYSAHSSIDTDIAPYDRGRYATGNEIELTFEDLNFQGEYIWRARTDRLASGSAGIVNKFMAKFLPAAQKEKYKFSHLNDSTEFNSPNRPIHLVSLYENEINFESLLTRFITDYNNEVKDNLLAYSTLEFDQFSAFSELVKYGFDSFASLEDIESDEFEEELGKKIKSKYYKNPIYKFLVRFDIDNFLKRQPINFSLTSLDEKSLFERKKILFHYYNSMRQYAYLPYASFFKNLFGDTKSYANRVYNQQYKGTLKILRRLFLINSSSLSDPLSSQTVLKFDQLLYKSNNKLDNQHEELKNKIKRSKRRAKFLKESFILPCYIGWDSQAHKLIFTNRYLSTENIFNNVNADILSHSLNSNHSQLPFISWPIQQFSSKYSTSPQFMFHQIDDANSDLQKDLFEYTEMGDYETRLIYHTLPYIVKRVDLRNKDKSQIIFKPGYQFALQIHLDKQRG